MEQTEKYLNSILSKRIGSVINQSAFSKNANTVTRIPRQEEKVETMPTVFRKKYETVLMQQSQQPTTIRQTLKTESVANQQDEKPMGSHRVEYMVISKRLMSKKSDEYISPTVDITKYQKKEQQKRQFSSDRGTKLKSIMEEEGQQARIRQSEGIQAAKSRRRKIFS